jgi:hypothetical protein
VRKNRRLAAAAVCALATLAACEEGLPGREPLLVNAVSGAKVDLTGTTWESACLDVTSGSERRREVHGEEGAVTSVTSTYAAAGCTGTATDSSFTVYGEAAGDASVGWAGAPPAGLGAQVLGTKVFLDAGYAYGLDVYLVDDRASPRVLYSADPASGSQQSYPTLLLTGGEEER